MKILERDRAIELRKQGRTFGEILNEVSASKGSLSYWLRNITLTKGQLARIKYKNDRIKDKFITFNRLRRIQSENRKKDIIANAALEINHISVRELKLIGIALYWAEGYKAAASKGAEFINTDPAMIRLMMRWFREISCVPEKRFRIRVQLHNVTAIEKAKKYWSKVTGIPVSQFTKAYVKISLTSKRKSGNLVPYGTCSIRVSNINLITRIRGWIKGVNGAIV